MLVRRGFWRNSVGNDTAPAAGGGRDNLDHGLVKWISCPQEAVCRDPQWESQGSESDVWVEVEESSEVCDEASEQTEADEADADVASEEL